MGQKVHPRAHRIGITNDWDSRWFSKTKYQALLKEDCEIRDLIRKKLSQAAVSKVLIERSPRTLNVIIYSARAGVIIGRGGLGAEELKKSVARVVSRDTEVRITIEEVRNPQSDASIVAQNIVAQLEKRLPFRRVLKQSIDQITQDKNVKGSRIVLSGRLDGSEMSRYEKISKGRLPLSTLRAVIDYARETAFTTYGTIGVKVWVYRGEVFNNHKKEE